MRTKRPKEISVSDYLDYWLENAIKKILVMVSVTIHTGNMNLKSDYI